MKRILLFCFCCLCFLNTSYTLALAVDNYTTMAAFESGGVFALHNDQGKWLWTNITGDLSGALGLAYGNGEWVALGWAEDNFQSNSPYDKSISILKDGEWQPVQFQKNPPIIKQGSIIFSRAIWDDIKGQWYAAGAVIDDRGQPLQGLWATWKKGDQNWTVGLADQEFAFLEPSGTKSALVNGKNHYACVLNGSIYIADKNITSTGVKWVKQHPGIGKLQFNSIAWGYDKWVAIGDNPLPSKIGQTVYCCNNDESTTLSWTPVQMLFNNQTDLTDIKWDNKGNWFVVGTNGAGTSVDGTHWNTFDFNEDPMIGPYLTYDKIYNHWIAGLQSDVMEICTYYSPGHWDIRTDVGEDTFSGIASQK